MASAFDKKEGMPPGAMRASLRSPFAAFDFAPKQPIKSPMSTLPSMPSPNLYARIPDDPAPTMPALRAETQGQAAAPDEAKSIIDQLSKFGKKIATPDADAPQESWMTQLEAKLEEMRKNREELAKIGADRSKDTGKVDPRTGAATSGTAINPGGDYFTRVGHFESGTNDTAVNKGSGATGRYQFLPSTWAGIVKQAPELGLTMDGITDPGQQDKAMRYFTAQNAAVLMPIINRNPTGGELYLAHLLGAGGASAVLRNPGAPITETISGPAYSGNPFLRAYQTGSDLIAGLNKQFGGA